MSVEWFDVSQWVYQTLTADTTLQDLLAGDGRVPGHQQGIYMEMAPQVDPISQRAPVVPLVVVSLISSGTDERALCGNRIMTYPVMTITGYHRQDGAIALSKLQAIMNRIDVLLDNQISQNNHRWWFFRDGSEVVVTNTADARVEYGVASTYRCYISVDV